MTAFFFFYRQMVRTLAKVAWEMFTWPMTSQWEWGGCLFRKVTLSRHLHTAIIKNVLTAIKDIFFIVSQVNHQSKWAKHWLLTDDVSGQGSGMESLYILTQIIPQLEKKSLTERKVAMPAIESLSMASDDPLISQIRLDMKSVVRILRASFTSCRTWARSLCSGNAALPDCQIKKYQRCLILFP